METTNWPRTAKDVSLHSDAKYSYLLDSQSKFPYQWVTSQTQASRVSNRAIDGQRQVYMGAGQVGAYSSLLGSYTRFAARASQNKPQTELFGTAPYVALGRGLLRHTDEANAAWFGARPTLKDGQRMVTERQLDRFDFIDATPVVEKTDRAGLNTRVGPSYARPGWQ